MHCILPFILAHHIIIKYDKLFAHPAVNGCCPHASCSSPSHDHTMNIVECCTDIRATYTQLRACMQHHANVPRRNRSPKHCCNIGFAPAGLHKHSGMHGGTRLAAVTAGTGAAPSSCDAPTYGSAQVPGLFTAS
jgi:hypothetical protein